MRELLADANIRLSIAGKVLSTLGDNALWIALGIWVKMLTGSSSAAGLSFFAFTLGLVCAPLGGVLVDRYRRRPTLVVLNLLAAVLVLPLLLVRGRADIWVIYLVLFGYGVMSGFIGGAQNALTRTMVPEELLGSANGLLQTLLQGLRLISPLIGAGALAAFGASPLVVGDAATFVIAALLMCAVRVREERPARSTQRLRSQLTEGVRHIAAVPLLRQLVGATALAVVAFGMSETVVFAVVEGLHRPPAFLGVLDSVQGAGAVAGGVVVSPLMRGRGERPVVALGLLASGLGFLLTAVPAAAAVLAGVLLIGVGLPWIIAGLMTALQRGTPARLMGRVSTAASVITSAPQTVAVALGAVLLAVVDFRILLLAMTALLLLSGAYLATRRRSPAGAVEQDTAARPEAATPLAPPVEPGEAAEPAAAG